MYLHLFDFERPLPVHRRIEEVDNMRAHKGLSDAISGGVIRKHDGIGSSGEQMLLASSSLARAMIFSLGFRPRAVEDDIDVDRIGGSGRYQSASRSMRACAQTLLMGCITGQR